MQDFSSILIFHPHRSPSLNIFNLSLLAHPLLFNYQDLDLDLSFLSLLKSGIFFKTFFLWLYLHKDFSDPPPPLKIFLLPFFKFRNTLLIPVSFRVFNCSLICDNYVQV